MLNAVTANADILMNSWAYWSFKLFKDITTVSQKEGFYDGSGQLEDTKVKALSYTYPQAVAGNLLGYRFDFYYAHFYVTFTLNTVSKKAREAKGEGRAEGRRERGRERGKKCKLGPFYLFTHLFFFCF
jgi:hypothetical protein